MMFSRAPFVVFMSDISSCASGNGNTTDGGQCVFIGETPRTWHAARTYCLQQGGDLLSLSSKTLNEDITRLMRRTNDTMTKRHWIGATSVRWNWVTGGSCLSVEGRLGGGL